jgi:uncharacterized protein (TIGR02270 family)
MLQTPLLRASEHDILWDVIDEHLCEASFLYEQLEGQLEHPLLSLAEVARGVESRLLAHLDGLVVGGDITAERVLVPALSGSSEEGLSGTCVATMALLQGGHGEQVWAKLVEAEQLAQRAILRGCLLAESEDMKIRAERALFGSRYSRPDELLVLLAGDKLDAQALSRFLESDEPTVVAAAAKVASRGAVRSLAPRMLSLLSHPDPKVYHAAALGCLAWGIPGAWAQFWQRSVVGQPGAESLALFALLSPLAPPQELPRRILSTQVLMDLLAQQAHQKAALFALGFCGDLDVLPVLLAQLQPQAERDSVHAKLALQSISLLTGLDLNDATYVEPNPELAEEADGESQAAALPTVDQEDLSASLLLTPEDFLPMPQVAAVQKYCSDRLAQLPARQQCLRGQAMGMGTLLDALANAPMRVRHVLGLGLGVSSGGRCWLDTRALVQTQQRQLRTFADA